MIAPTPQPFVLGANYWPRRKAMYWWSQFDAAEVREEFALMRAIGLSVVRIFLLWDDFQPQPDQVSPTALQDLETVCTIAAEHGLKLDITFFTGHMSGPNWAPRWLLGGELPHLDWIRQVVSRGQLSDQGYRNPFHDPLALDAARLLLRTVVTRLKHHPAVWMWNLGNEPDLFAWPNSAAEGRAWARQMTDLIHEIDPLHPVTLGLHSGSLHDRNGLMISDIYAETDVAVMHSYPMYVDWSRQPLDPDFVPYTCAITAALCGKPVLMEEIGGCTTPPGEPSQYWEWEALGQQYKRFMASEEDLADYLRLVLPKLQQVGATGAVLWCFADYMEALWDRPPCDAQRHERFFGLVRPDGSLKPHAEVIKQFAETQPIVQPIPAWAQLQVDPAEFNRDPNAGVRRHYPEYLAALQRSEAQQSDSKNIESKQ
ncbi:MAG: beta-galactosidase [Anaerolineales bacterium]|nr:beta-galactosidase [Anaerolineales bacterium]MCW5854641.1 beta-galactosidase [Anaerolineales bacterium]